MKDNSVRCCPTGWCIGGNGLAARSKCNPSEKSQTDQSPANRLMMAPSNPKCTSQSSIVASSPQDSHSTEGTCSEGGCCEMSSERLRSIVLNEVGGLGLGDGYRCERIAMRIEDSIPKSIFCIKIYARNRTVICEPYRRAFANPDTSWAIWRIVYWKGRDFHDQAWLSERALHDFQIRHVGTKVA